MMIRDVDPELDAQLKHLNDAPRAELLIEWKRIYKTTPPRYASLLFLRRSIAYAAQERVLGRLAPALKRQLTAIAASATDSSSVGGHKLKPGTRLLRTWHGESHEVIVTDTGFYWNGVTYNSLTAVATEITGTKWNGRRFFGLVNKRLNNGRADND